MGGCGIVVIWLELEEDKAHYAMLCMVGDPAQTTRIKPMQPRTPVNHHQQQEMLQTCTVVQHKSISGDEPWSRILPENLPMCRFERVVVDSCNGGPVGTAATTTTHLPGNWTHQSRTPDADGRDASCTDTGHKQGAGALCPRAVSRHARRAIRAGILS